MLIAISAEFSGLPDLRTLHLGNIRRFYDALRPSLMQEAT